MVSFGICANEILQNSLDVAPLSPLVGEGLGEGECTEHV